MVIHTIIFTIVRLCLITLISSIPVKSYAASLSRYQVYRAQHAQPMSCVNASSSSSSTTTTLPLLPPHKTSPESDFKKNMAFLLTTNRIASPPYALTPDRKQALATLPHWKSDPPKIQKPKRAKKREEKSQNNNPHRRHFVPPPSSPPAPKPLPIPTIQALKANITSFIKATEKLIIDGNDILDYPQVISETDFSNLMKNLLLISKSYRSIFHLTHDYVPLHPALLKSMDTKNSIEFYSSAYKILSELEDSAKGWLPLISDKNVYRKGERQFCDAASEARSIFSLWLPSTEKEK